MNNSDIWKIRSMYPEGTRIIVDFLAEEQGYLPKGSKATVDYVSGDGIVYCEFDCGYHLGLYPGVDGFRRLGRCVG